jgi:hypothetical protein
MVVHPKDYRRNALAPVPDCGAHVSPDPHLLALGGRSGACPDRVGSSDIIAFFAVRLQPLRNCSSGLSPARHLRFVHHGPVCGLSAGIDEDSRCRSCFYRDVPGGSPGQGWGF